MESYLTSVELYLTTVESCLTGVELYLTAVESCLTGVEVDLTGVELYLTGPEAQNTGHVGNDVLIPTSLSPHWCKHGPRGLHRVCLQKRFEQVVHLGSFAK
ncbi:hypothetical protein BH23BAC4_BH23BAC4_06980 [soil metagenome]